MTHPLRNPAFRRLFIGRALSAIGTAVIPGALALAVLRITDSPAALATVLACAMVPRVALMLFGGVVADRYGGKRISILTDSTRCVTQLAIGLELFTHQPQLPIIAAASAVGGIATAFAQPAMAPLVVGAVPEQSVRQQANALLASTRNAANLIGPALAGAIVLGMGPGWAFILDAATFAVSAILLLGIPALSTSRDPRSLRIDLAEGWSEVRSRDWYWTSLIAHGTWNTASGVMAILGPSIAVRQLGGERAWVFVLEAGGVGLLAGSLVATRIRVHRPVLLGNAALAFYAVPLTLLAIPAPVVLLAVFQCLALVSCARDPSAEAGEGVEDLFGGLGPDERLGV
ncbi:MFS transporter, partial [Streptomyces sp. NPDC005146]